MQDEINEKVVALSIKTTKLTAEVLQKAMKLALSQMKKELEKPQKGKQSLRQLMKPGDKVTNMEITDDNIKSFDSVAKKHHIDYNVKKITGKDAEIPTYLVFFKAKDVDVVTEAFREYSAKKLNREERPAIREELAAMKEKAAAQNAERATVKKKEKEVAR